MAKRKIKQLVSPGQRFGRWTVLSKSNPYSDPYTKTRSGRFLCLCDCGTQKDVRQDDLKSGASLSCGCYHKEVIGGLRRTHGMSRTPMYKVWEAIISRTTQINCAEYHNYGGRGIYLCDRWKSFELFFADMGERPDGMTIERIDNDGPYSPGNCRWATQKEQCSNTRRNRFVTFLGRRQTVTQWAQELGIPRYTLDRRLKRWPVEKALTCPVGSATNRRS